MSDPFIPANILGRALLRVTDGSPWYGPAHAGEYVGSAQDMRHFRGDHEITLDTRDEEVRDQAARVIARVLGVPVGATAPQWWYGYTRNVWRDCWMLGDEEAFFAPMPAESTYDDAVYLVPSLSSIPLDSPDREALALASILRWLDTEVAAGRITMKETTP